MSISFNLLMSDRKRHPLIAQCFGILNIFSGLQIGCIDTHSPFYKGLDYHKDLVGDPSKLLAVEYAYEVDIKKHLYNKTEVDNITSAFLEELNKFLNAFPWVNSITKVNKRLGVIRVKAKGVPADKMMFVLASVRNLTIERKRTTLDRSDEYKALESKRKELIPNYTAYWVYYNLMDDIAISDFTSGERKIIWRAYPRFNDESNVLNAATFGKKSLKRLLSGEEPEWYQDNYNDTAEGYDRDEQYEDLGISFGTEEILWDKEIEKYDEEPLLCSPRFLYRTMSDSLSVEWDHECIFDDGAYDPLVGFMYTDNLVTETIENFLKAIEE